MTDNADVPRGPRLASNATLHPDLERRRGSADSAEQAWPSNVTPVDTGVGSFGGVERLGGTDGPRQHASEWSQTKTAFTVIADEADAVVRRIDQEKEHVVGLAQALSQIQDSFEKLHSRFAVLEERVESFETINGRLGYRLESTFDAIQEYKARQAELGKTQLELRAAIESAEHNWSGKIDGIRALAEENRQLRAALTTMARDNKLVIAELANIHSKIGLLEEQVDTESLFVRGESNVPYRSLPQREQAVAAPHEPRRVLHDVAAAIASESEAGRQASQLNPAGYQGVEFRGMNGAIGSGAHSGNVDDTESRAIPQRKVNELQALSNSYESLLGELEHPGAAPTRGPEMDTGAELANASGAEASEFMRLRSPHPLAGAAEHNKINSMRSMYEKRTEDLKAELLQERRERKFAECALRVARAERLHLQHELAKVRAMGWRKITHDAPPEPAPAHEPEAVKRRFTAA